MKPSMSPHVFLFAVLVAVVNLGLITPPAHAVPMYTVTNLRFPSGDGYLIPKGINSSRDIIGLASQSNGTTPYL